MANCKSCGSNKLCGCKDKAYTTIPTFQCLPDTTCPSPEVCSEFTDANCVLYSGYGIVDLNISTGDRLNSIVQKLILLATNPDCVNSDTCLSVDDLSILSVTNTTITPLWGLVSTGINYQVEYKVSTAGSFSTLPESNSTTTQATISSLIPNTDYHIRVNTFCTPILSITNGGTLYGANGTHTGITFTGGAGTGMIATITVASGIITNITVTSRGSGYLVSDILTPVVGSGTPALTHGVGTNAQFTIDSLGNCYSVTLLVKTLV